MMLVDAHRVEPAFGGEFELIHEVVVHVMRPPGVEQRGMNVDPDRGVLLPEIVGQLGIGHQMEPHQLHGSSLGTPFRKMDRRSLTAPRGPVNRQRAPITGKWTATGFSDDDAGIQLVDSPETYCNNFQRLAAWTPTCTRL